MTNTDISHSNGRETLTVSANSPMSDLMEHHCDTLSAPQLLDTLTTYAEILAVATADAVTKARAEGTSWAVIGQNLGVSAQGAQQRYGR
jgi:hypothetical protein